MRLATLITTCYVLGLGCWHVLGAQTSTTIAATATTSPTCEAIGRILSVNGNQNHAQVGKLVCGNQPSSTLSLPPTAQIELYCRSTTDVLSLNLRDPQTAQRQCPYDSQLAQTTPHRKCGNTLCPGSRRSGRGTREPVIITPYEIVRGDKPITFSWQAVPGATSYVVTLRRGNKLLLEEDTITTTHLIYPRNAKDKPLVPGSYNLRVEAEGIPDPQPGEKTFTVLGEQDAHSVSQVEARLKQLLPLVSGNQRDELFYLDLDLLYSTYSLWDDAIASLTQIVDSSQRPQVYRTLGDRYADVGQLDSAMQQYEMGIRLAENTGNDAELRLLQERRAELQKAIQQ